MASYNVDTIVNEEEYDLNGQLAAVSLHGNAEEILGATAAWSEGDTVDADGQVAGDTVKDTLPYVLKSCVTPYSGDDVYKMTSAPRGICLIINNVEFEGLAKREGSDREANILTHVFRQLYFKVIVYKDQTAEQMNDAFASISKDASLDVCDCFVGIVLTHGVDGGKLAGTDCLFVHVETLLSHYNNLSCKSMIGKPKLFFVQACRGKIYDFGVTNPREMDAIPQFLTQRRESRVTVLPTWTDVLLCYSTIQGQVSFRDELTGSWFGDALARILCDHSYDEELYDLLLKVNQRVNEKIGMNQFKQSIEYVFRGWTKKLYFNPGVYDEEVRI